ncbi:MAG: MBOAT family O-acyltransferase [Bacteroidia bacterium]
MLFHTLDYFVFLPIVFILYWFVFKHSLKLQNGLLLVASYTFYAWWDWRFLSLIIFSSVVDYLAALFMQQYPQRKKLLLAISLLVNLGMLAYFKYFGFFIESFIAAFESIGISLNSFSLSIILPVGISFYTFQTLSYTIDVYRNKLPPTRNLVVFMTYVSFFPQLVAGPIERATQLLPQFFKSRKFSYALAADGMRQILWGLFKKVVIADHCAMVVNEVFSEYQTMPASMLVLGIVYFAFQIYGDFSGYSDIAIGTAKLFGFNLMRNFSYPYFSRDIAEFWRRWHISLSTWFRDYLYIPLGGSQGTRAATLFNVMIVFVVSGFWHGANWTFVVWGTLNGLYFIPLMLAKVNHRNTGTIAAGQLFPSFRDFIAMIFTFSLTCFAWIFFRSIDIHHAFSFISHIFSLSLFSLPEIKYLSFLLLLLIAFEWLQREKPYALEISRWPFIARWVAYIVVFILIIYHRETAPGSFIYYQF